MEVTKNNYEEIFPQIVEDIRAATFVCIDGEFTGLNNGLNVTAYDTPEETYLKTRSGSMDFLFIQFGLSIFTQDEKTGKYRSKSYVFYLFPWHRNNLAPDPRFLCQTSSITFLVSNNFDFNKLFREGIPYLNSSDESDMADAMETKRSYQANQAKESPAQAPIPVPKQYKSTVDLAMKKLEKVINGSEEEVKLDRQPAFVRKLIYQSYDEKFGKPEGITLRSENGSMICKRGQEDKKALDDKELEAAVGFSRVVRAISTAGCLVVGHNMLLDLCHLVHRFIDRLPPDYEEFKEMVHTLFPRLVDTKLISAEESLKDILGSTTLESMLDTMFKPPFHLPEVDGEKGYSYEGKNCQLHNAGYDSYITGKIFLGLVRAIDPDNKRYRLQNCKALEKFMNKIYLMRAPDTCMDLVRPDPVPQRDHVFHITFPSSWTSNNISKVFSPYGSIQVSWTSDTSAWVTLYQKDEAFRALKAFEDDSSLPAGVSVTPYNRYVKEQGATKSSQLGKRKASATSPLTSEKKKKSSSSNHLSRNGRKSSPPQGDTATSKGKKENAIKTLEEAASFDDGVFGANTSWD